MATNFIKDILDGIKSMYLSKESDEKKKILNDELDKVYLKFTKEVHYVLLQYEVRFISFVYLLNMILILFNYRCIFTA